MTKAVGAVDGVYDPGISGAFFDRGEFFPENVVVGESALQLSADELFRFLVGAGDKTVVCLFCDLQIVSGNFSKLDPGFGNDRQCRCSGGLEVHGFGF